MEKLTFEDWVNGKFLSMPNPYIDESIGYDSTNFLCLTDTVLSFEVLNHIQDEQQKAYWQIVENTLLNSIKHFERHYKLSPLPDEYLRLEIERSEYYLKVENKDIYYGIVKPLLNRGVRHGATFITPYMYKHQDSIDAFSFSASKAKTYEEVKTFENLPLYADLAYLRVEARLKYLIWLTDFKDKLSTELTRRETQDVLTIDEVEVASFPNKWIRFEEVPDEPAEFFNYQLEIRNRIKTQSGLLPEDCIKNDRLRFEWYWDKFISTATSIALIELSNQSYTNFQNVKAWILSIENFIAKAEASGYKVREQAQKEIGCKNDEVIAYLKIALDVYTKREQAPVGITLEAKVFANCFIILPFLKWKFNKMKPKPIDTLAEVLPSQEKTERKQSSKSTPHNSLTFINSEFEDVLREMVEQNGITFKKKKALDLACLLYLIQDEINGSFDAESCARLAEFFGLNFNKSEFSRHNPYSKSKEKISRNLFSQRVEYLGQQLKSTARKKSIKFQIPNIK